MKRRPSGEARLPSITNAVPRVSGIYAVGRVTRVHGLISKVEWLYVTSPKSVWYGLTYNPFRKTMATDRKPQSALLLRHLLHEQLSDQDRKTLVDVLNEVRQIPEDEGKVWDWDGKTHVEQVGLPVQIT